ncbi:hypothetical protein [Arthrobacter cupressi]|uniref:hypothetical protein n=1 Tax=Arthrobacter cupressi TaxID=1045773 RepID=UPI001113E78E|nr:hypothetical protein [Arthrobacter cupressi]
MTMVTCSLHDILDRLPRSSMSIRIDGTWVNVTLRETEDAWLAAGNHSGFGIALVAQGPGSRRRRAQLSNPWPTSNHCRPPAGLGFEKPAAKTRAVGATCRPDARPPLMRGRP